MLISPKSICTRLAQSTEREFLYQVYASTRQEEMANNGWSEEQQDSFLRMQSKLQQDHYDSHYPGIRYEIISADGQDIGRLYLHENDTDIRLADIALFPEFRGQGIGTFLIQRILEKAKNSAKTVSLHVETYNPSLQLYRRLGFGSDEVVNEVYLFLTWSGSTQEVTDP